MKYLKYKVVLFLLVFMFLVDFLNDSILMWLNVSEGSTWAWLLEEGTAFMIMVLLFLLFYRQQHLLRKVKESEEQYRVLTEISPKSVIVFQDEIIVYVNPAGVKTLGAENSKELIGKQVFDFIHPDFQNESFAWLEKVVSGEKLDFTEIKIIGLDGQVKDVESLTSMIYLNGKQSFMSVGRDITERKKLEKKAKESEEQYRKVVEFSPIGIILHKFGEIKYVNDAGFKKMGASSAEELLGRNTLEFIFPNYHEDIKKTWEAIYENNKPVKFKEEKWIRLDQKIIDVEVVGLPVIINGEKLIQIFFRNITDRKKAQELIYQLAYQDPLTGLPNRRLFEDHLHEKLAYAKTHNKTLAVMFIDLDGFKKVNDLLGHEAGDEVLKEAARRLKDSVRTEDILARLAGDEFTVLLPDISRQEAFQIAESLVAALQAPLQLHEKNVNVTSSIGISFYEEGKDDQNLIKQADVAMYKAKQKGKNTYHVY